MSIFNKRSQEEAPTPGPRPAAAPRSNPVEPAKTEATPLSSMPFKTSEQALMIRPSIAVFLVLLLLGFLTQVHGYSVLTHEAIIDAAWETGIRPVLLRRFPNATPDELRQAHGFAFGGAIIQDLGYYPHGSHFFSDLVHYVRSGDFIEALIRDSQDLNEYAFALGALAHYAADSNGHRIAVNRAVPILYPALRREYSDVVTYEDDPAAHLRTEFGFDVLQVAKERYAADTYHNFIGFEVSTALLERAFQDIYAMPLRPLFGNLDNVISSYRYTVSTVIPKATKVAWVLKKKDIQRDLPGITQRKFLYNLSKASYEKEWGKNYQKPGLGTSFLAFIIRVIPKIGPLKVLSFRTPTPETEKMFMASFNTALDEYRHLLADVGAGHLDLPNLNLDTGSKIHAWTYFMQDEAYARLLSNLDRQQFKQISPELRSDILTYFGGLSLPAHIKRDKREKTRMEWKKVPQEVEELKSLPSDSKLTRQIP
jgi:Zinc dependent phospholipase C